MKASLVLVLIVFCAMAQPSRRLAQPDGRMRRIALVIGNDDYPGNRLHNAVNDARSMKSALEEVGFRVQISIDATQQQMEAAIDDFTADVNPGDIALFFYAGHGIQINDQNYLIPIDFQARTAVDAKYKAYPAQRVQENLEAAGAAMQILAMDACRNNPFRSWRGGSEGLAAMQAGRGTYIAFATSPGKTAADNPEGRNGLFTGVLVDVLREPGLNIDQVFTRVRDQVYRKSHGQQLPWSTSSVTGEFYFRVTVEDSGSVPLRESNAAPPRDLSGERELAFWNSIKDENDAALLEEYLHTYPAGAFASIAKTRLNRLKTTAAPPVRDQETGSQLEQGKKTLMSLPATNGTSSEPLTVNKWVRLGSREGKAITFNKDVLPILEKNCQSCHRPGEAAPMVFLTYNDTRPWAKAIKAAVTIGKMPPWFADPRYGHFANDRKLTEREISVLVAWVENGVREGDATTKPAPVEFMQGWSIGKPDKVIEMPQAFAVPPQGTIEYQYIIIPSGFTKDTWVTAAEVRPGNPAVVFRARAFVRPHNQQGGGALGEFLVGFAPGLQPQRFDLGGAAKLVPAGSDIVLQMHYIANGKAATDVTKIGLVLAKGPPQRRYLAMNVFNKRFVIPPGDPNYEVKSQITLLENTELVWLMPQMNVRGKDFEFRVVYPSGASEILLNVPKFDFNWQLGYDEVKPLVLPKGSRIECTAHFDNSPSNMYNPDPTKEVRWGDQSWAEIMIGWFAVVIDSKSDPSVLLTPNPGD